MRLIDGDELYREYQSVVCHDIACAECKAVDRDTGECRVDYLISDAPTIDAVSEWVPCSDRLPTKSGSYLVTVPIDDRAYVDALNFHKGKFYECDSEWGDIEYDDVIAWMPLPKPYERSDKSGYCNECKWYGDKQVCGRCRSRNLYVHKTEPQTERYLPDYSYEADLGRRIMEQMERSK